MEDLVVLSRTHDLLAWLLPKAESFPRVFRTTLTARLLSSSLDLHEKLIEAAARKGRARADRLRDADAELRKLRSYLRLAHGWKWLSDGQYEHVSRIVAEIGKLLGGWLRQTTTVEG